MWSKYSQTTIINRRGKRELFKEIKKETWKQEKSTLEAI